MKKVHEVSALNHSSAGVVVFRKRPVINTKVFFDTRRTIAFDFGLRGNRRVAQFCFAPNSRNILINRGARSLNTAARNYISLHGQFLSTEAIIFASPAVRGPLVYFAGARSSTLAGHTMKAPLQTKHFFECVCDYVSWLHYGAKLSCATNVKALCVCFLRRKCEIDIANLNFIRSHGRPLHRTNILTSCHFHELLDRLHD